MPFAADIDSEKYKQESPAHIVLKNFSNSIKSCKFERRIPNDIFSGQSTKHSLNF